MIHGGGGRTGGAYGQTRLSPSSRPPPSWSGRYAGSGRVTLASFRRALTTLKVNPTEVVTDAEAPSCSSRGGLNGGVYGGRLLRRAGIHPLWQPEIVLGSEASKDRNRWTNRIGKLDLRLCFAARIPLVGDGLRIAEPGRTGC